MDKYKKGKIVKGIVTGITDYGIFVSLDKFYSGLIHISEISDNYITDICDVVDIGEVIKVEILEVDDKLLRSKLSIKNTGYANEKGYSRGIIKETSLGFKTLRKSLPIWIEKFNDKWKSCCLKFGFYWIIRMYKILFN